MKTNTVSMSPRCNSTSTPVHCIRTSSSLLLLLLLLLAVRC